MRNYSPPSSTTTCQTKTTQRTTQRNVQQNAVINTMQWLTRCSDGGKNGFWPFRATVEGETEIKQALLKLREFVLERGSWTYGRATLKEHPTQKCPQASVCEQHVWEEKEPDKNFRARTRNKAHGKSGFQDIYQFFHCSVNTFFFTRYINTLWIYLSLMKVLLW